MFKIEGSIFEGDRVTMWELSRLPPHVKHVSMDILESARTATHISPISLESARGRLLPNSAIPNNTCRHFNFESLEINKIEDFVALFGFESFIQKCCWKLKVLIIGNCDQHILNIICKCHWRSLHTLRIGFVESLYVALNPENFPRLEKISIYGTNVYIRNNDEKNRSFEKLFENTKERKQIAVTTFLVMRHLFPAELAFIIAEEVAFGLPLKKIN